MGMLEKFGNRFADNNGLGATKDVFYKFKTGVNHIRLVGDMIECRSHYLAGNQKRGNRGLCPQMVFEGDDKIPVFASCNDWDVAAERRKPTRECPICQLVTIASRALSSGRLNEAQVKFYTELKQNAREMTSFKVNIIDRDDPYITVIENGAETKRKGLKIASLSYTVAKSIYELSSRFGFGIEHPDKGIDIEVTRSDTNGTTSYKVLPVFGKNMAPLVTPLTDEERSYQVHDLLGVYDRGVDYSKIRNSLHGDLISLLDRYYPLAKADVKPTAEQPQATAGVDFLDDIQNQSMVEAKAGASVLDQFPANKQVPSTADILADEMPF